MSLGYLFRKVVFCFLFIGGLLPIQAQVKLEIQRSGPQVNLKLPSSVTSEQEQVFPEYTIQRSQDLSQWETVGGKVRGINGRSGAQLSLSLPEESGKYGFYRTIVSTNPVVSQTTGQGGAEVFGYNAVLNQEIDRLGALTLAEFAQNYPQPAYLSQISWDPTTAKYWTNFNADTNVWNSTQPTLRLTDFRLNTNEMAIFQTNGFVVSERLGSSSFADIYYNIFTDDLPVFVSSDAILHAWHKTYVSMLEEMEELELATLQADILTNMSAQLPAVWQQYGNGPLRNSILDADYYLCVARSLWVSNQVPSALGDATVDQNVTLTLNAIKTQTLTPNFPIFGSSRTIDFSQFKVRGHYVNSDRLCHYFQTTMWCGRVDFRPVTFEPNKENDIRQLGAAIIMDYLLKQSGGFQKWSKIEQITRNFIGTTDSMTFEQLDGLLASENIQSPADVSSLATLTNLQTRLLTGELGVQSLCGDSFFSPVGKAQAKLPRSFTICGQKFTLDSWAFSKITYDSILWPPNAANAIKVMRRKPSCLDIAFSVLGNNQILPDIAARIANPSGVPWRDGYPYQHSLSAVRNVIDGQSSSIWTNNIYMAWLGALRSLSAPTTDSRFPEAMRTRAWAYKTLNTQLASWTQLRHDTLLYVQQSYTRDVLCSYPAGFVEPRPEFFQRMGDMAMSAAAVVSNLNISGTLTLPRRENKYDGAYYDLSFIKQRQVSCLTNFAARMSTLRDIAEKELAQLPLDDRETSFLRDLIEDTQYYTGVRSYSGWYPQLFYKNAYNGGSQPSAIWDCIVADVHTDLPDQITGDPGAVIHEGIGKVNLLMIAVDNGPDRMVYAGPVLSHYEFEEAGVKRLSDEEWRLKFSGTQKPPSPEWTQTYLVPNP